MEPVGRAKVMAWVGREVLPHEADLRAWLRRSLRPDDIEDIVQEAYCRISALEDVAHIRSGRAYLFVTARMLVLERIRRSRVVRIEAVAEVDTLAMLGDDPSPEQVAGGRRELARVRRLIEGLPDRCRRIFVLRKIDGLSQRQVAETMGVPEHVVENDVGKGLKLILKAIAEGEAAAEPHLRAWRKMDERETAAAISDRAAEWVARIDRSGGDAATQAELDAWLAGDDRRRGAYFRAQSAWMLLDRARVLEAEPAPAWTASRRRLLWGGGGAIAASLVAALGIGLWPGPAERIETALGEIRRVPLKDGSFAAVNTATSLSVRMQPELRQVALDRGEAWFQVAKDPARPFVVEAGKVRVRAVGTAFSVRLTERGTEVQVTEGVVEVWSVGAEPDRRRVSAGERAFVGDSNVAAPVEGNGGDIERNLAWRTGQLIFDGDTLGDAAAEFNRYNDRKVRIADTRLAGEKFVGRFRTNEPEAFARAAATLLGARAEIGGDEIRLSKK